jgi:HEAT repeat protein
MRQYKASLAALPAIGDLDERVRAVAADALTSAPWEMIAGEFVRLLGDKSAFVRQEAAFAMGKISDKDGTQLILLLVNLVETDPYLNVRAAAALSMGSQRDRNGSQALIPILEGSIGGKIRDKSETEIDFLRRSAAIALGQIGDRSATPSLIAVLENRKETPDTRREAARALGLIGDPSANSALRSAVADRDPYLSEIAFNALARISELRN